MKVAFFGAFDPEYPRTRVLREGLAARGIGARLIAVSPRAAPLARHAALLRGWAVAARDVDAILVPSFGHRDVALARLLARASGRPLLFDPLVSRWETQVGDLERLKPGSAAADRMRRSDRFAMGAADVVLADTWAHADFYVSAFGIPRAKVARVPVGADEAAFAAGAARASRPRKRPAAPLEVAYVGGFLPLHGVSVIVEAAALLEERHGPGFARFTLTGDGMTAHRTDRDVAALGLRSVRRRARVSYEDALAALAEADVALGIFGTTEKAARVVPHKVYQALAIGVPTVTRSSVANAELFQEGKALVAIPEGDAPALAAAIEGLANDPEWRERIGAEGRAAALAIATPGAVGRALEEALETALARAPGRRRALAPPGALR